MVPNDFDALVQSYQKTDVKPDKLYSMLPTVSQLTGDLSHKTVLDLGCGSGFFTRHLAKTAKRVIGLDNSLEQIALARKGQEENVSYLLADIIADDLPSNDLTVAPFVLGYMPNVEALGIFLKKVYSSLNEGGELVSLVDLPAGHDLSRFGAKKILHGQEEGSKLEIQLFNQGVHLCTLWGRHYSKDLITKMLEEAGFKNITWHKPIISEEGIKAMPEGFWNEYIDACELGYVKATK